MLDYTPKVSLDEHGFVITSGNQDLREGLLFSQKPIRINLSKEMVEKSHLVKHERQDDRLEIHRDFAENFREIIQNQSAEAQWHLEAIQVFPSGLELVYINQAKIVERAFVGGGDFRARAIVPLEKMSASDNHSAKELASGTPPTEDCYAEVAFCCQNQRYVTMQMTVTKLGADLKKLDGVPAKHFTLAFDPPIIEASISRHRAKVVLCTRRFESLI